jgi:hypothetical protein
MELRSDFTAALNLHDHDTVLHSEMTQDAEARMAVLLAIRLDDAPVVVAAHGVGLEPWHDSYIQYVCTIVKADRNRLWWASSHSKYGISRYLETRR